MNHIIDNLWIGNLHSLRQLKQDDGAWTIITLLDSERLIRFSKTMLAHVEQSAQGELRSKVWRLADNNGATFLCDDLSRILNTIDDSQQEGRRCLVHCAMGVSRSAAVCAAWLISRKNMSVASALGLIREARPEIQPNMGFLAALRALEKCNGNVEAAQIRFSGHRKKS